MTISYDYDIISFCPSETYLYFESKLKKPNERFKSKKNYKDSFNNQLLKQNKSYYERPNSVVLAYISHLDLARFFSMKRHVVYTRKKVS